MIWRTLYLCGLIDRGCKYRLFARFPICLILFPLSCVQVTFCANQVKKYELALVVDIDGIGEEVLALPITAR